MNIPFFSTRKSPAASPKTPENSPEATPLDLILTYHEETKHHYHRFARSLGYLDWESQPNPFRRFPGAPVHVLPLLPRQDLHSYGDMFRNGAIAAVELSEETLSRFFRNSLAISAWKRYETAHWALRVNPSSGNLHPTEAYAILGPPFKKMRAGVYHYAPKDHALEQRALYKDGEFEKLSANLPAGSFFVGLSSIHWREAWKYGERAFRYCQHDVGHALAALRLSAAVLGWQLVMMDHLGDNEVAALLGLNRKDFDGSEPEHPDFIAAVFTSGAEGTPGISVDMIQDSPDIEWFGLANTLSKSQVDWPIIESAERSSRKDRTEVRIASRKMTIAAGDPHPEQTTETQRHGVEHRVNIRKASESAEAIIQQRRSCLSLDGVTSISKNSFYRMLLRTLPATSAPFDAFGASLLENPHCHLAIFVHRVEGLDSGLYMLVRDSEMVSQLQEACDPAFLWWKPLDCPESMEFFLLKEGDFQKLAAGICCGQEIGGDGAFSLGMICEFEEPIRRHGPWFYRRLFWETGFVGQILYLEAEAAGVRSTGIGCFFDDPMHETLGLKDRKFQSLYHFTVGGPVEDTRLTTEAAYDREV